MDKIAQIKDGIAARVMETAQLIPVKFTSLDGAVKAGALLEIADTPELRRIGLSKRAELPPTRGMFFDKAGTYWMRDVNFPLDLIFVDKAGTILQKTAMPVDNGATLYPPESPNAAHAIELPFGFIDAHDIRIGDTVTTGAVKTAAETAISTYHPQPGASGWLNRKFPRTGTREDVEGLQRAILTPEYARLQQLAKPVNKASRLVRPFSNAKFNLTINPGHVPGTSNVGLGNYGGQGVRDQFLGLVSTALAVGSLGKTGVPGIMGNVLRRTRQGAVGSSLARSGRDVVNAVRSEPVKQVMKLLKPRSITTTSAGSALTSTVPMTPLDRGIIATTAGTALKPNMQGRSSTFRTISDIAGGAPISALLANTQRAVAERLTSTGKRNIVRGVVTPGGVKNSRILNNGVDMAKRVAKSTISNGIINSGLRLPGTGGNLGIGLNTSALPGVPGVVASYLLKRKRMGGAGAAQPQP